VRIVFVLPGLTQTAGTRYIREIAEGAAKAGHKVTIVSFNDGQESYPWLKPDKVEYINMDSVKTNKRLPEVVPECDLIVATVVERIDEVFECKASKKVFNVMLNYELLVDDEAKIAEIVRAYKMPFDGYYCSSTFLKNYMKCTYNIDCYLVNCGVNLKMFYPMEPRPPCLTEFNITILALGKTYDKRKGTKALFEACAKLYTMGYDVNLMLYGGQYREVFTNAFHYTYVYNPSDEFLNQILNTVDVFISPSHGESCCMPVREALAAGTPVIATGIGDEDVTDISCARLISVDDPDGIVEAVRDVMLDRVKTDRLRKMGMIKMLDFSWYRTVIEFLRFIEGLK